MHFLVLVSSISAALIAAYAFYTQDSREAFFTLNALQSQSQARQCCASLNSVVPGKVHYAGSPGYDERQNSYYAGVQTSLKPSCRVLPDDATQVSSVVKTAVDNKCKFAVVSGGHMSWEASNIGPEGFSLDLANLNLLKLSTDNGTVSLGPGNRWGPVYKYLTDRGLIAVGGRVSDVGVGGFLTGGGVSFLSFAHGWGASNIKTYEVVLANGSVVEANSVTHADLYKALRFGSTNYGIITRFDLATVKTGDIWGGSRYHSAEDTRPLLDQLVVHSKHLNKDPTAFSALGLAWSNAMKTYMLWSPIISTKGPEEWPSALSTLKDIGQPLMDTTRRMTYVDATEEINAAFPGGKRAMWFSLNVKVDGDLMWDIFEKGKEIFAPHLEVPGIEWDMVAQPIPVSMIKESRRNGGDYSGLKASDGDQWLLLGAAFWLHSEDDTLVKSVLNRYQGWCEGTASARGKLVDFIYPNYASSTQNVMDSFGPENVAAMKAIQELYDPELDLSRYWKGGFKLQHTD